MDWNWAIEKNREALKRVLAMLVAMAKLGGQFTFFPREGAATSRLALAEKSKLSPASTLPRHLHRAVLRLLRPAEAAARRLVIVAARGLVVTLPPPRPRKAKPAPTILRNGVGTGILMPPARPGTVYFFPQNGAAGSGPDISGKKVNCPLRSTVRPLALPLLDPLRRFRPARPVASSMPRISLPGYSDPFPVSPRRAPSPDDPVDATRLSLRLAALASALDDLPRQARRFARWKAARDAISAQNREARDQRRVRRIAPLRGGRPPGQRPAKNARWPAHDVHEILATVHGLAFEVLQRPDTS